MFATLSFKTELSLIVNNLAKSVVTEIFSAAEKVSLNKPNPETEEKLSTLVDSLCVEAVDKILKMVVLAAVKQEETPGDLKDSAESEESSQSLMKPAEGADGGPERPPKEQTYILVYGSAAVDSKCQLVALQSDSNANGVHGRVTQPGEVRRQDFQPENLSNRKPTAFIQQPIESIEASANDSLLSLSANVPLWTNQLSSLKMPRRAKRKRSTASNPSFDTSEQVASPSTSTQHHPAPNISTINTYSLLRPTFPSTSTSQFSSCNSLKPVPLPAFLQSRLSRLPPAGISSSLSSVHPPTETPSTPKIFKEIYSILPLSSGGKKKRCKITVEELTRRVGPPEYMSFSSLAAYLRTDNNARKELQVQLEDAGIKPTQLTADMSLFSRLCEEEVEALCESLAGLVQDHLPFEGLHVIPEAEDDVTTLGRLVEFRSILRRAVAAIKDRVEALDLASHGFMSKMLDIILFVFEKCLDNQMRSIY